MSFLLLKHFSAEKPRLFSMSYRKIVDIIVPFLTFSLLLYGKKIESSANFKFCSFMVFLKFLYDL